MQLSPNWMIKTAKADSKRCWRRKVNNKNRQVTKNTTQK